MAGPRHRRHPPPRRRRPAEKKTAARGVNIGDRLPPDILEEIHSRLTFLDRIAFALVVRRGTGRVMRTHTPWLFLPSFASDDTATLVSIADHNKTAAVPTCDPAMRGGRAVVGSSHGWLVTADARGALRLANPVTGAQAALPSIAKAPLFSVRAGMWYELDGEAFARLRFGGPPPYDDATWGPTPSRSFSLTAEQLRKSFYRKVVLSASPRSESFDAMLVTDPKIGAPAFATSEDRNWSFAPSPDAIEDAIHHDGRFYSLSTTGVVEAWDRDNGSGFTSKVVAPRLNVASDDKRRKYLAVAPDGRFMVVFKESKEDEVGYSRCEWTCVFKVQVLDEARQVWDDEPTDILHDVALFVGVNSSICVSTREHPEITAGCVYFTDDEVGKALLRQETHMSSGEPDDDLRWVGVYSFSKDRVDKVIVNPEEYPLWPLPAWFTPSVF